MDTITVRKHRVLYILIGLGVLYSLFMGLCDSAQAVTYTYSSIDYPGSTMSNAYGISDAGDIVGYYRDGSGSFHGYSYDGASYTSFDYPGAKLTYAYGISNNGDVVGLFEDSSGNIHGFQASVVPEPVSSLLFITGGTLLAIRRYLKKDKGIT